MRKVAESVEVSRNRYASVIRGSRQSLPTLRNINTPLAAGIKSTHPDVKFEKRAQSVL